MEIDDAGQEEFAVEAFELADISHPTLVRVLGGEVAFQQVSAWRGVGSSTPPALAAVCPNEAGVSHQAGHAVLADPPAVATQLPEHTR